MKILISFIIFVVFAKDVSSQFCEMELFSACVEDIFREWPNFATVMHSAGLGLLPQLTADQVPILCEQGPRLEICMNATLNHCTAKQRLYYETTNNAVKFICSDTQGYLMNNPCLNEENSLENATQNCLSGPLFELSNYIQSVHTPVPMDTFDLCLAYDQGLSCLEENAISLCGPEPALYLSGYLEYLSLPMRDHLKCYQDEAQPEKTTTDNNGTSELVSSTTQQLVKEDNTTPKLVISTTQTQQPNSDNTTPKSFASNGQTQESVASNVTQETNTNDLFPTTDFEFDTMLDNFDRENLPVQPDTLVPETSTISSSNDSFLSASDVDVTEVDSNDPCGTLQLAASIGLCTQQGLSGGFFTNLLRTLATGNITDLSQASLDEHCLMMSNSNMETCFLDQIGSYPPECESSRREVLDAMQEPIMYICEEGYEKTLRYMDCMQGNDEVTMAIEECLPRTIDGSDICSAFNASAYCNVEIALNHCQYPGDIADFVYYAFRGVSRLQNCNNDFSFLSNMIKSTKVRVDLGRTTLKPTPQDSTVTSEFEQVQTTIANTEQPTTEKEEPTTTPERQTMIFQEATPAQQQTTEISAMTSMAQDTTVADEEFMTPKSTPATTALKPMTTSTQMTTIKAKTVVNTEQATTQKEEPTTTTEKQTMMFEETTTEQQTTEKLATSSTVQETRTVADEEFMTSTVATTIKATTFKPMLTTTQTTTEELATTAKLSIVDPTMKTIEEFQTTTEPQKQTTKEEQTMAAETTELMKSTTEEPEAIVINTDPTQATETSSTLKPTTEPKTNIPETTTEISTKAAFTTETAIVEKEQSTTPVAVTDGPLIKTDDQVVTTVPLTTTTDEALIPIDHCNSCYFIGRVSPKWSNAHLNRLNRYCNYNCLHDDGDYCPESICRCGCEEDEEKAFDCKGIGMFRRTKGIREWCIDNCLAGNCPSTMCECT